MVDAKMFHQNYPYSPRYTLSPLDTGEHGVTFADDDYGQVKNDPGVMTILCSPTVLGFSLMDNQWCKAVYFVLTQSITKAWCLDECSVNGIRDIEWSLPLSNLAIPEERKDLILAYTKRQLKHMRDVSFGDVIMDKRRGVNIILQYCLNYLRYAGS